MTKNVKGLQKIRDIVHIRNFLEKDIPIFLQATIHKTHIFTEQQRTYIDTIMMSFKAIKDIIHHESFQKLQIMIEDMFPDIYQVRQMYQHSNQINQQDDIYHIYQETSPNIRCLLEWDISAAIHPKIEYTDSLGIKKLMDNLSTNKRSKYLPKIQDLLDVCTKAEVCRVYVYQRKMDKEYLHTLFDQAQQKKQELYDSKEDTIKHIIDTLCIVYPGIIQSTTFEQYYGNITNLLYTHYRGENLNVLVEKNSHIIYGYTTKVIVLTMLQLLFISKNFNNNVLFQSDKKDNFSEETKTKNYLESSKSSNDIILLPQDTSHIEQNPNQDNIIKPGLSNQYVTAIKDSLQLNKIAPQELRKIKNKHITFLKNHKKNRVKNTKQFYASIQHKDNSGTIYYTFV
jgi:polyhydroxyalkanoate synthesis regulator phasin